MAPIFTELYRCRFTVSTRYGATKFCDRFSTSESPSFGKFRLFSPIIWQKSRFTSRITNQNHVFPQLIIKKKHFAWNILMKFTFFPPSFEERVILRRKSSKFEFYSKISGFYFRIFHDICVYFLLTIDKIDYLVIICQNYSVIFFHVQRFWIECAKNIRIIRNKFRLVFSPLYVYISKYFINII